MYPWLGSCCEGKRICGCIVTWLDFEKEEVSIGRQNRIEVRLSMTATQGEALEGGDAFRAWLGPMHRPEPSAEPYDPSILLWKLHPLRDLYHFYAVTTSRRAMSVDLTVGAGGTGQQPSDDEVIAFARDAIEAYREESRRGRDGVLSTDLQQPGVTVDLGHRNIVRLPDEVIDIIKQEIERCVNFFFFTLSRCDKCSALLPLPGCCIKSHHLPKTLIMVFLLPLDRGSLFLRVFFPCSCIFGVALKCKDLDSR